MLAEADVRGPVLSVGGGQQDLGPCPGARGVGVQHGDLFYWVGCARRSRVDVETEARTRAERLRGVDRRRCVVTRERFGAVVEDLRPDRGEQPLSAGSRRGRRVGEELARDKVQLRVLRSPGRREGPECRDPLQCARKGGVTDDRLGGVVRTDGGHRVGGQHAGDVLRTERSDECPVGDEPGLCHRDGDQWLDGTVLGGLRPPTYGAVHLVVLTVGVCDEAELTWRCSDGKAQRHRGDGETCYRVGLGRGRDRQGVGPCSEVSCLVDICARGRVRADRQARRCRHGTA